MAATLLNLTHGVSTSPAGIKQFEPTKLHYRRIPTTSVVSLSASTFNCLSRSSSSSQFSAFNPPSISSQSQPGGFHIRACLPDSSSSSLKKTAANPPSTKLYVSGLSFRTTEEILRNAFKRFGQLDEVNLVMDRVAKRPKGFAFLRYTTEVESRNAIEGMHGRFLDGRVIFVEVAKPRSELRQRSVPNSIQNSS